MSDQAYDEFATRFAPEPPRTAWLSTNAGPLPRPIVALRPETTAEIPAPFPSPITGTGRYQILGEIARGGMGAVLRGRDCELNRDLAVKVLLEKFKDEPEVLRRFFEEAQIGGQLQHPGIVPIYDIGTFADNRPFFAMKLVKGRTLAELLAGRRDPAADLPRLLTIFEQISQTVAYAHSKGVIHRDLKPANVMVGAFGEVQVMDWGLAKVLSAMADEPPGPEVLATVIRTARGASDSDASLAGSVMGTYAYMPPEQALGDVSRVDERADVFGLGAILCEILTGKPAYSGRFAELRRKSESADLADAFARLEACGCDAELASLARAMLAADPDARPRDASEVARAVAAHLAGVQDRLHASELARARADVQARAERMRLKLTVALAGSILLTAMIGGGAWLSSRLAREAGEAETDREVGAALAQAEAYRAEALRLGPDDLQAWQRTLAASVKAADLLSGRAAREGLEAKVHTLRNTVDAEATLVLDHAQQVEADRSFAEALDRARLSGGRIGKEPEDDEARSLAYATAFRDAGIDLASLHGAEATRRLSARPLPAKIATALDDLALINDDEARALELLALARSIDPDPFRDRLREAVAKRDRYGLLALAVEHDSTHLPPATASLLAKMLDNQGAHDEAIDVLLAAWRRSPGDFWINHDLGRMLNRSEPPRREEALRFLTAAVALKPDSPAIQALHAATFGETSREVAKKRDGDH